MIKTMLRTILLVCLFAIPLSVNAQSSNINRADLLDKKWYFIAMKCPDNLNNGTDGEFIHYYSSLQITASNGNNVNYGTYVRVYKDMRDNPRETGTYSITTDEVGNLLLTLKRAKTNVIVQYLVPMVETNHLTLIRTDESEKCKVIYAIAL